MKFTRSFTISSFLALGLGLAFFAQGVFLIQETSPTADEIPFHTVNGYAYLLTRDYRMSPANPALLREWMALPWLFIRPRLDLDKKSWKEGDSENFGKEFFYRDNRAIADRLLTSSRFMILLLGLALGAVIYLWSRSLYGPWGGVLSLSFYALCPNFIAHSAIAHTDVGVTLFLVLAAFFLWRYLEFSRPRDLWLLALAFGFACAAKQNALFFGPLFLLILLMKKGLRTFLEAALLFLASSFFVIWFSYGFEFKPLLGGGVPRVEEKLGYIADISKALFPGHDGMKAFLQKAALERPIPIPSYVLGVAGIIRSHRSPYFHYAFGEWTTDTQWYYYLFCFLAKLTLPFLFLLMLRILFFQKASSASRHENLVVLLPAAALFFATFFDSAAVGVRYLFPIVALFFVWIGGLVKLVSSSRIWTWALSVAVFFNIATTLPVFPNYLSYFNPLVGGVQGGYRYVRGSDVDWGQGLKALKRYMGKNKINRVVLRYFGPADPSYYGIQDEPLTAAEAKIPQKKVYAIGLYYLEHAEWTREKTPTALVGGAIFVYDFR